jgi:apolipoprotein N-acyltransferase
MSANRLHHVIRRWVNPIDNPVCAYAFAGIGMAVKFLLCAGGLVLALHLVSMASGDRSGAGGLVGFIIVPLVGLAGVPWSVLTLRSGSSSLFLLGMVLGPIINGALFGAIRGYVASLRMNRDRP